MVRFKLLPEAGRIMGRCVSPGRPESPAGVEAETRMASACNGVDSPSGIASQMGAL